MRYSCVYNTGILPPTCVFLAAHRRLFTLYGRTDASSAVVLLLLLMYVYLYVCVCVCGATTTTPATAKRLGMAGRGRFRLCHHALVDQLAVGEVSLFANFTAGASNEYICIRELRL